jgi:all-trans-retinol 13,14-reductase
MDDQTLKVDDYYDCIVIGSGIGGLSCASFLSQVCLQRVLVLEQHPTSFGGCTHEFERKGLEFDTGIHYVGGDMWDVNSVQRKVFDFVTGGKVNWLKMDDAFDTTTVNGEVYEIRSGIANQLNYFKQKFPNQPVEAYFSDIQRSAMRYSKFIVGQIADAYLPRLFVEKTLQDSTFGEETVDQALDRLKISDPTLRKILTYNYGDYGFEPSKSSYVQHAMTVAHYANGSSYPVGGPHQIADSVQELVEKYGGKMLLNARVQSIYVENGEARGVFVEKLRDRPIKAKIIVSAAGAFNTYVKLLSDSVGSQFPAISRAKEAFASNELEASPTFAMVFAAFKGTKEELNLPAGNLWIQDSANFKYVFLSFPSARDNSWSARHPDRSVVEIIVETNYEDFANLSDKEYQEKKKALTEELLLVAYRYYPRLKDRLLFLYSSSPRTSERFLGTQKGCAYGVAPTPMRFRANRDWLKPQTPIKNLFLAGQDTVSPGMCGGMWGGMIASCAISAKCLTKARELIFPVMGKL